MTEKTCCLCGATGHTTTECMWRTPDTAPKDGTLLRLLVWFTDHALDDGEGPTVTLGNNFFDNTTEDVWQFVGWCWEHDHFTDGKGEVIAWMPLRDLTDAYVGAREDLAIWKRRALEAEQKLRATPPAAQVQGELPEPVAEVYAIGGPHDSEDRCLVELQAELPPVGTKLYAHPPAAGVSDKGPWRIVQYGERVDIQSDDFEHDVALTVTGDFSGTEDRLRYATRLALWMNEGLLDHREEHLQPAPPKDGA